jgi:molecular chaperone GrpE
MDKTPEGEIAPDTPLQPAPEAVDGDGAAEAVEDPQVLRELLEERNNQYLRLAADFENFRRRKGQELTDRIRYSSEDAARALLPALDNLRRAIDHAPEGTDSAFIDGVRMVVRQFEEALATLGVTPIDAVGAPFDPALHEAVAGVESPEVEHDTVVDELQRGYRLHDRVIRPSVVRVAHPVRSAPA